MKKCPHKSFILVLMLFVVAVFLMSCGVIQSGIGTAVGSTDVSEEDIENWIRDIENWMRENTDRAEEDTENYIRALENWARENRNREHMDAFAIDIMDFWTEIMENPTVTIEEMKIALEEAGYYVVLYTDDELKDLDENILGGLVFYSPEFNRYVFVFEFKSGHSLNNFTESNITGRNYELEAYLGVPAYYADDWRHGHDLRYGPFSTVTGRPMGILIGMSELFLPTHPEETVSEFMTIHADFFDFIERLLHGHPLNLD